MKKITLKQITAFIISAFITAGLIVLVLSEVELPFLSTLELKSRDLRFRIRGPIKPGGDVVVVVIDEASIEAIGRFPWPRYVFAPLIAKLHDGGASAIGFDIFFSEPEKNPELEKLRLLMDTYTRMELLDSDPRHQAFFEEMVEAAEAQDSDAIFAEALRQAGNVVIGMAFFETNTPPLSEFPPFLTRAAYESFENKEALESFQPASFSGENLPIDILAESAKELGFVNFLPDPDNAKRRGLATLEYGGALLGSLAIRVAQTHLNLENDDITLVIGRELRMGPYKIPINRNGFFYINYYGANQTLDFYSVIDILDGTVKPETFKGKSVFIGGAATALGDVWPNPFVPAFWGVEAQATMCDNILTQRFITRESRVKYVDSAVIAAIGLILSLLLLKLSFTRGISLTVFIMGLVFAANQYAFTQNRTLLLMVYPLLETLLVFTVFFFSQYFKEIREKRHLRGAFEQYLNPAVVRRAVTNPEGLALGGEKKELTVLFTDIRGFTSISEGMSPDGLVDFMNEYLTAMTDIVMKHDGTLDKYIGDAIMAFYGAPEDKQDHAVLGCKTALEMVECLYEKRRAWVEDGLPPVWIGIGINTGEMVVGNMGSEKRFDYTVMGDNVNLASRLESLNKVYDVKVIVSEYTQEKTREHFLFRELDYVRVKGKKDPVKIFELLSKDYFTDGKDSTYLASFHEGLGAYRNMEWDAAIKYFEETLKLKPDDRPSILYIDRCKVMIETPPPEDWDSVFILTKK